MKFIEKIEDGIVNATKATVKFCKAHKKGVKEAIVGVGLVGGTILGVVVGNKLSRRDDRTETKLLPNEDESLESDYDYPDEGKTYKCQFIDEDTGEKAGYFLCSESYRDEFVGMDGFYEDEEEKEEAG